MKRRNFVILTGVGISAIILPTLYYKYNNPEYNPLLTEPEFLSSIWDANTIQQTGEIFREQFPSENSERKLVNLLSSDSSSDMIGSTEIMNQKILKDYIIGNIVMIDGWILSKTEARQCALFSITKNN